MIKKILKGLILLVVICFSFVYTDKAIILSRNYDPIMKVILQEKDKYSLEVISPQTEDKYIIPGIDGLEVDIDDSYYNMKSVGKFDDKLLSYNNITVSRIYDKYIHKANPIKKEVTLLIKITKLTGIKDILNMLTIDDVRASFLIDEKIVDSNIIDQIKSSYQDIVYYDSSENYEDISKYEYCIISRENDSILKKCSDSKKNTIIPNMIIKNNIYSSVKAGLSAGSIIMLDNAYDLKEVSLAVKFIKQKGLKLSFLKDHLSSKRNF